MGVDSDLVGVIVACSVGGVCLIIVVIFTSFFCFRRIERKRRKTEAWRANGRVGWPVYPPVLQPIGPPLDHSNRIGGYRPRILSPSSPGSTAIYNTSSTNRGPDDVTGTPDPQTPNHHPPSSSSSPHHSVTKANGHVLVPFPAGYPYYGYVNERPDFYDARFKPPSHDEDARDTVYYYPDQPYHSTLKDHAKGPAPDVPQSPATNYIKENGVSQEPLQQHKDSPDKGSNKGSAKKSSKKQSKKNKNKTDDKIVSETKATSDNEAPPNANVVDPQHQSMEKNKDSEPNQEEVPTNSSHCKVIKKQHNHSIKMPEWMTREYVEKGVSMELEGEGDTSAMDDQGKLQQDNGVPGMVSVMVRDYSIKVTKDDQQQQQQQEEISDQNAMSLSTMEESTTSIVQDYSSTNYLKNFSILDYVDEPGTAPSSDVNQNTNIVPSRETVHVDAAILEQKAAVLKQIRQKVNESAEKMPPAFTSTPRVNPDAVSSEDSSEEMLARRQRQGAEGSVDALPPVGDTNF